MFFAAILSGCNSTASSLNEAKKLTLDAAKIQVVEIGSKELVYVPTVTHGDNGLRIKHN